MPNHDGVIAPSKLVREAILANLLNKQIRPVQCLLVIAGMYATHRCWMMDKEIPFAQTYGKLFIGLPPWGRDRIPESVQAAAHEDGGGGTNFVVATIRRRVLPRSSIRVYADMPSPA